MKALVVIGYCRLLAVLVLIGQITTATAQVEANGFAWLRTGGGPLNDGGTGLAVDAATNVIAVGVYSNSVSFSGATLTNAGSKDIFVASYRRDGDLNWSRIVPGVFRWLIRREQPVLRSDGTFLRDYLHVDDIVTAYLHLAEHAPDPTLRGQGCNFSDEPPQSVMD